jgi:hypothetical protein
MFRRTVSAIIVALMLTSTLTLAFNIQQVQAVAVEVIIDTEVGESRFTTYPLRQSPNYWVHVQNHDSFQTRAYGNNYWYTLCGADGHGQPLYYGTWQTSLPSSGIYEVFVWIPNPDAFVFDGRTYTPTQSAIYQIYYSGGMTVKTVNQRLRTGGWYSLGSYTFGASASVILNDRTGETYLSTMLAFDAIKFVGEGANHAPYEPYNPSPYPHENGVLVTADLSWSGGDPDGDAVTYDVYFGLGSSPPQVSSGQSATTYNLGTLSYAATYYWKIVSRDEHGLSTGGLVWDFTTQSPPSNQPPTLYNGYVSPPSGDTSTTFSYYVTYSDPEGDAPTTKYVYIDGSPYTMAKISGDYVSGAVFKYSTALSVGSHNYYFYFADSVHSHTVRLPTSGTYSGPTVPPAPTPDFSISASPTSLSIQQGSSGSSTITITSINGFNQLVQLSVSGAPSGVTATLTPSQVSPPAGGTATSTLTVSVSTTALPETYTLTVIGTGGDFVHFTDISLQITSPPQPPNQPPNEPTWVSQLRSETVLETIIPEGGTTPEPDVCFRGTVSDPDGDSVRLEIELREIDEAFTGIPTTETLGEFVPSGASSTVTRFGLFNGGYHWQYRAKDSKGATSDWVEYRTPGNLDFTVSFPDIGYAIVVSGQGGWREQWILDLNGEIAYRALRSLGFDDERIEYLSNSLWRDADGDGDNDVDGTLTLDNFRLAITRWAAMRVGRFSPLILYLVGHGFTQPDIFFLDADQGVGVSPALLDDWLKGCPENTPMLIVIDACFSGCFITAPETISASNRIIIASTHADQRGYPYFEFFSREFWRKLADGMNVKQAFVEGTQDANDLMTRTLWAGVLPPPESAEFSQPWLDDNGDAVGHPPDSLGDDGLLAETMKIGITGSPFSVDLTFVHLGSPCELRVYDSEGRVTGVVDGEVKEEIPHSVFIDEYEVIVIAYPADLHSYELAGTGFGIYELTVNCISEEYVTIFNAVNIPIQVPAVHQYSIDWISLSLGGEGVTVEVDSDGDGVLEYKFTSDSELTRNEFLVQTGQSELYSYSIVWGEETFTVSVESNSTVGNFAFSQPDKEIGFDVSGSADTIGFCNVSTPKALLYAAPGDWMVLIDGASMPPIITENLTHCCLYFTYAHSTHEVQIVGTWVIGPPPPPPTYSLTITTTVGGTTDPTPGTYSYAANSTVQVTAIPEFAIPEVNILFEYWELDSVNVGSANPYTALMDKNHTLKAVFSLVPSPLSVSISPLSASIPVGQQVTFTSTVSGGYTPYTYQWYLNDTAVSGATMNNWAFTPIALGTYIVHLRVTDAYNSTVQSETARIVCGTSASDVNRDGKVDLRDISLVAIAFGSYPGHPRWNLIADLNQDGKIDLRDIALVAKNFGKTYS